jgi:hypothetical protein
VWTAFGGEWVYGEGRMASPEEVMTTRRTEGDFKAELRIVVVPWMAGAITSRSGFSVLRHK